MLVVAFAALSTRLAIVLACVQPVAASAKDRAIAKASSMAGVFDFFIAPPHLFVENNRRSQAVSPMALDSNHFNRLS